MKCRAQKICTYAQDILYPYCKIAGKNCITKLSNTHTVAYQCNCGLEQWGLHINKKGEDRDTATLTELQSQAVHD